MYGNAFAFPQSSEVPETITKNCKSTLSKFPPKYHDTKHISYTKKLVGSNQSSDWNTPGSIAIGLDYPWLNQSSDWNANILQVHSFIGLEYPWALSTSLTCQSDPQLVSGMLPSPQYESSMPICPQLISGMLLGLLATTKRSTTSTQH